MTGGGGESRERETSEMEKIKKPAKDGKGKRGEVLSHGPVVTKQEPGNCQGGEVKMN